MIDCGPAATHKLVKAGLWPTDIDYIFFTHHHFDHDVDYQCYLLCRWYQTIGKESVFKYILLFASKNFSNRLIICSPVTPFTLYILDTIVMLVDFRFIIPSHKSL